MSIGVRGQINCGRLSTISEIRFLLIGAALICFRVVDAYFAIGR
jgi:hypothetical protein